MKKKKYIVGTLAAGTALTLATVGTSTVSADTVQLVNNEAEGTITTDKETFASVESLSNSQATIIAAEVQAAGKEMEQAQSAVDTQQAIVETATQAFGTAEQVVAQVNEQLSVAEETAAQATPETIQKAEAVVNQAKATQSTIETSIQPANDSVNQAQEEVDAQVNVVNTAKQVTSKEQADVDAAQNEVSKAEAAFDSETLLQAQQEAGSLDAKVKEEQKTVFDIKSNLASKEQEEADLIANGSKTRTKLEQVVTSAGPEYFTEVVERELARHEVSESESVSTPKEPTFIGNDGKTYYVVANENVLFDGEKVETIVLPNKEALNQQKVVDYRKVSEYVREYIVELRRINGIDIPVPEVTETALKWAKARTDEMAKNDELSHATVLKPEDFGLSGEIENASWGSLPVMSILNEREIAYNQVLDYFNDFNNVNNYGTESPDTVNWMNYGHRNTMLAASGTGFAIDATNGYGIMTFVSTDGTGIYDEMPSNLDPSTQRSYDFMGETHYYYPTLAQDLGKAENKDADPLRSEYYFNGKRIKFLPKTTFRYIWEETLYHKNTKREEAVVALTNFNATQKVAEQAIASAISTVKTDLVTAQNKLSADEKALKLANDRVAELTADNSVKVQTLKLAQAELAIQQSELSVAKDNQAKEEEKLARLEGALAQALEKRKLAQSDLEQAKKAVLDAEQALLDLQTAQEKLEKVQVLYAEAQQKLADAKEKLDIERSILEDLQAALKAKQVYYKELNAKLETAQAILKDLEDKARDNVIVTLPDGTIIAVPKEAPHADAKPAININDINETIAKGQGVKIVEGEVLVNKTKSVVTLPQTATRDKVTYSHIEYSKTLPNTGVEESNLLIGIGTVLGGLGLASIRRRQQG
ncbi:TPA: LPXTG cell wall anchor domain-containing protein [Streptococcus suis]|nr:LPXTG cell wall anchor domain-containing protein [Streptococcus suis]